MAGWGLRRSQRLRTGLRLESATDAERAAGPGRTLPALPHRGRLVLLDNHAYRALVTLLAVWPALAAPQQSSSQSRAQQIAAAFTKQKHVVAEKRGLRKEKYKDIRSEPIVKQDITEYSGVYHVVDFGDVIDLQIGKDGRIQADGHDSDQPSRTFVLQNGKIEGAVLTAIKVYRDGATERFEGVFMTRTERNSPTDPGSTTFGLGVVLTTPREFAGNTFERLFYQLKP